MGVPYEEPKKAAQVAPPPPPARAPLIHRRKMLPLRSDPLRSASLYVGDLDPEVDEVELFEAFRTMGPIASVRLCRNIFSGNSLRYAFVNFFHHFHACLAMAFLNHTKLRGKTMRIMWNQRIPLPRKTGIANLFVKNLNPSISSLFLQRLFCNYGTVLSCKVAEENGISKGFGFVQFESESSAMAALNDLHNTMLEGKKLYVHKFIPKSERILVCEEPKFTNLYVKNLVEDVTEDLLRSKFSKFGKISNVSIMRNGDGKSRGFGFINFESPESAKKAMDALNGALLESKNLFVGRAQKKTEREELLKREHRENLKGLNLYVKNLVMNVNDSKLKDHFSACGRVTSTKVMCKENGMSKGFGFVCFSSLEESKKALDTLHGSVYEGRRLYVAPAQRKEDRRKELQNLYHAQCPLQSFHPPNENVLPPHYPLLNPITHQPNIYQQFGTEFSIGYPIEAHNFQLYLPTFVPMTQTQQENSGNWVSGKYA